jgi:hypothetical protein
MHLCFVGKISEWIAILLLRIFLFLLFVTL